LSNGNVDQNLGQRACNSLGNIWPNLQFDYFSGSVSLFNKATIQQTLTNPYSAWIRTVSASSPTVGRLPASVEINRVVHGTMITTMLSTLKPSVELAFE
jgi:hypothetical protein